MNTPKKGKPTPKNNKWKDPFWAHKQCELRNVPDVERKDFVDKMKKGIK